jgi:uncharacterized membrane protein
LALIQSSQNPRRTEDGTEGDFEKLQKVDIEKSTELKEVIVKGKSNTKKYDMNLFSREPTQSIDIQKRFLGHSFMGNYYRQFI